MRIAKEELLDVLKDLPRVKCAHIWTEDREVILQLGYSDKEWEDFLLKLNFAYDSGYGSQEIFGNVWLEDGKWLDRAEYDGSEWWAARMCPIIPEKCYRTLVTPKGRTVEIS